MKYSHEMNLVSASGYSMPFEEKNGNVEMTLGYGEQIHPQSGKKFYHHGIDLKTDKYLLKASADGTATGMGTEKTHGMYLIIQYGGYSVKYGHLSNCYVRLGQSLKAGQPVAVSSDLLHLEVKFNDEEIDPRDFITMLFSNMVEEQRGKTGERQEIICIDIPIETRYDQHKEEIEDLMLRYYPEYIEAVQNGSYNVGKNIEQSLRNIFSVATMKEYFFETIPSACNPLGIGMKSAAIAGKVQNLLIEDFVQYLALRRNIFLSGQSENEKKKP